MIKCAVFDLDGTLINTISDLGRAADYTLEKYGIESKWTIANYSEFVGNGVRALLDCAFKHSLNDEELDNAAAIFREKYNSILVDNSFAYDGIKDSLDFLKKLGIRLAVVTNKPDDAAVKMVEHIFGKGCFDVIIGAQDDVPKKPNPASTLSALKVLDCTPDEAVYLGDSDVDMLTAKNAGIKSVGCSWGYRSRECLENAGADDIIDNPKLIVKLFQKNC